MSEETRTEFGPKSMRQMRLETHAENVCRRMGFTIDPITIAAIISAIVAVIQLIQDCRETQQVTWGDVRDTMKRPGPWGWFRIRRSVINEIGRFKYRQIGGMMAVETIVREGDSLTNEQLEDLFEDRLDPADDPVFFGRRPG